MLTKQRLLLLFIYLLFLLSTACAGSSPQATLQQTTVVTGVLNSTSTELIEPTFSPTTSLVPTETVPPVETVLPQETPIAFYQATKTPSPSISTHTPMPLEAWQDLPILPTVSQRTIQIYQQGLTLGRDPHRFSKIGDCQNVSSYFLSPFEHPAAYRLGQYEGLQETIDWFKGSFSRDSLAVKGGFNVAAVLSPLRADPKQCEQGESPVACELRVYNPSFAIISMETWWSGKPENYEKYMRQLIEYLIDQGVVPILATKADNLEGGNQINQVLGQLAWEYDIPLWNFWASVQSLPDKGLTKDGFHLTLGNYFYDNPQSTLTGWSRRNLTALQALDAVWHGITNSPPLP
jgi:hypothetical protein